jgi:DNA-directed RNA polymerase, beta'' subunit/160 kD subunit
MIIGLFHLTTEVEGDIGEGKAFTSMAEAQMAYDLHMLALGSKVRIRIEGELKETTFGRALFNETLPAAYPFVNSQVGKKQLGQIVSDMVEMFSRTEVAQSLDRLKDAGFHWATRSGVSMASRTLTSTRREPSIRSVPRGSPRQRSCTPRFKRRLTTV